MCVELNTTLNHIYIGT